MCSKFTGEHPCRSAISVKFQSNFIETRLQYGCSPLNLLHIFRTIFPRNTSGWLLLYIDICFFISVVYIISSSLQFVLAGVFFFEGEIWHFPIRRWRSLAEAPRLLFTIQDLWSVPLKYVSDILLTEEAVTVEEQTHAHKDTHTYTDTKNKLTSTKTTIKRKIRVRQW